MGSKERKGAGRGEQLFTLEYQAGVFRQKALAPKHISRTTRQALRTTEVENDVCTMYRMWVRQAGSRSQTVDPYESRTVQRSGRDARFFTQ